MSPTLFTPFTLASGQTLRNRIAKAAMEEGLAGPGQAPDDRLIALYHRWGVGGAGGMIGVGPGVGTMGTGVGVIGLGSGAGGQGMVPGIEIWCS